jgi:phenylacetate-CoA ligase
LTKADLRQHLAELVSTAAARHLVKNASGGSTGTPIEFYQDAHYRAYWKAATRRAQRWYGLERGARIAHLTGLDRDLPLRNWRTRLTNRVRRRRFLNAFDLTEARMTAFATMLERWRPDFLIGYPSALLAFARHVATRHVGAIRPRAIQSGAERLWEFQRAEIEAAFGCPVIDSYGCRESAPIAAQCLVRAGLHVMADVRIVEIVDEHGREVSPGTMGRVVVTDLTNSAMPLIRYVTGDLASWKPGLCECGRTLPLLATVHGRSSDLIRTKHGGFIHGEYFTHLFYGVQGVEQFQVRQTGLEELEILIKPDALYRDDVARALLARIDAHTNSAFRLALRLVDVIPSTPGGKHRFTVSDIAGS